LQWFTNIELLINKADDDFGKQDIKDIKEFLTGLGFEKAEFVRVKQDTKSEYTRD